MLFHMNNLGESLYKSIFPCNKKTIFPSKFSAFFYSDFPGLYFSQFLSFFKSFFFNIKNLIQKVHTLKIIKKWVFKATSRSESLSLIIFKHFRNQISKLVRVRYSNNKVF